MEKYIIYEPLGLGGQASVFRVVNEVNYLPLGSESKSSNWRGQDFGFTKTWEHMSNCRLFHWIGRVVVGLLGEHESDVISQYTGRCDVIGQYTGR